MTKLKMKKIVQKSGLTRYRLPAVFCLLLTINGCSVSKKAAGGADPSGTSAELIFQSGFESGSKVIPVGEEHDIIGKDTSVPAKNDWVADLEKNHSANFRLEYTGGDISKKICKHHTRARQP